MDKRTDKKSTYIRPEMDVIALEAEDFNDTITTENTELDYGFGGGGSQTAGAEIGNGNVELPMDDIISASRY